MLQVQVACLHALLNICIQLEDTRGFFRLLNESQELFLSAPAAALEQLWLTAQAAAVCPAFKTFGSDLARRLATWQVQVCICFHLCWVHLDTLQQERACAKIISHCVQASREDVDAAFKAKLLMLSADEAHLAGDKMMSSRLLARSAFQCPWLPEVGVQHLHLLYAVAITGY
jgi:hypothetical protein